MNPGHENKFIMRMHTAATEQLMANSAASWTIQRNQSPFNSVAISKISNPLPAVKGAEAEVPCVQGKTDLTERYGGQVFYKNKPVEVEIQKLPGAADEFEQMRDAFAAYHGRLVDFAFDTASAVEWYYTGRLSVENEDEESSKLTLKLDTYPFKQSVVKRNYTIPNATMIDRSSNGWSVAENPGGATVTFNAGIVEIFGKPGDVVLLRRSASNNDRYTIAPLDLYGGDYHFNNGGEASRTLGKPQSGYLYLALEIDGSYYAWDYHQSGSVFRPCLMFNFAMTQLSASSGNVTGADGNKNTNPRCAVVLPSNARIRPELVNAGGSAFVLLDGEAIEIVSGEQEMTFPGAVLPGVRADRSSPQTICYLSAVGVSANDTPSISLRYREEVLG